MTVQLNLRLDPRLNTDLRDASARLGVTPTAFVRAAIRRFLPETDGDLMAALDDPELRPIVEAQQRRENARALRAELQKEIA